MLLCYLRSITPIEDTHDHPSEDALGLFFATAPSRLQHPPLPPLEEEHLPLVPTTRSRAATVPTTPAAAATVPAATHPLYTRTIRVYPQPHVVEIAREKIGSAQPGSSPEMRSSDVVSIATPS